MAHFVRLDEDNFVTTCVVVGNDIPTSNGTLGENDKHVDGETYCAQLYMNHPTLKGGTWKQTSYNHSFRKCFAGVGSKYDAVKDIFIGPQPYESWVLDDNNDWTSPVKSPKKAYEEDETTENYNTILLWLEIRWEEDNQRFIGIDDEGEDSHAIWDPDTSSWSRPTGCSPA